MPLLTSQWSIFQWTLYSIMLGIMGGMIGNVWANIFMRNYENKNKNVNWEKKFRDATIGIILIIGALFIAIIISPPIGT